MGVAHDLNFLSPLVTFSLNPIRVQDSEFVFYLHESSKKFKFVEVKVKGWWEWPRLG